MQHANQIDTVPEAMQHLQSVKLAARLKANLFLIDCTICSNNLLNLSYLFNVNNLCIYYFF